MVPVVFWFSRNPQMALPIVAIGGDHSCPTRNPKDTPRHHQKSFWSVRDPRRGFLVFLCCVKGAQLPSLPRDVLRVLFDMVTLPVFILPPKVKKTPRLYYELVTPMVVNLAPGCLKCVHLTARNVRYEQTRVRALFWIEDEEVGYKLSKLEDRVLYSAGPNMCRYAVRKSVSKCESGRGYKLFYTYTALEDDNTLESHYYVESKQFSAIEKVTGFQGLTWLQKGNHVDCELHFVVMGVANVKPVRIKEGDIVPGRTQLQYKLCARQKMRI